MRPKTPDSADAIEYFFLSQFIRKEEAARPPAMRRGLYPWHPDKASRIIEIRAKHNFVGRAFQAGFAFWLPSECLADRALFSLKQQNNPASTYWFEVLALPERWELTRPFSCRGPKRTFERKTFRGILAAAQRLAAIEDAMERLGLYEIS